MPDSHEPHAPTSLRLITFGGLSLMDGRGVAAGQQKRRLALLALLSAAGEHGMSRDRLVAYLSPERGTESARHALQQLVYYLRQLAGEKVFLGIDPLRLNPDVITSDLQDFEAAIRRGDLVEAASLHRGPFLDGFHLESGEFEEWVVGERSRLSAKRADALFRLAQSAEGAGDHATAVEYWRHLAAIDPLSGRIALGLVRALAAASDSAAAIRHARAHEAAVRSDLGRGVEPELARFVARLQAQQAEPALLPFATATASAAPGGTAEKGPEAAGVADHVRRAPRRTASRRGALVGTFALLSLTATLFTFRAVRGAYGRGSDVYPRTAIAVLPFVNLTVDSSRAYFAHGLEDALLMQLSRVAGLRVPSRQSVSAYRGANATPLRQIARDLKVGSVLEVTVQVVRDSLRVTAQLIDANADTHLWGEQYDRKLDDAFAIQSALAREIVTAVGVALTAAEARALASTATSSPEAYRLYLQGRVYYDRGMREFPDVEIAERFFERAIVLDPKFALAHVALSEVHGTKYHLRYDRSAARSDRQHSEAETALRLAPDLPEAHLAIGTWHYHRGDYPRALAELRIAVEGLPNSAEVWARIGQASRRLGNWTESVAAHERTTQLDSRDAPRFKELGVTYVYVHRYVEARAAYDEAMKMAPDFQYAHLLKAFTYVYGDGRLDSLRAVLAARPFDPVDGDWSGAALQLAYWDRQAERMLQLSTAARYGVFEMQFDYWPAALYAGWAHRLRGDQTSAHHAFGIARALLDSAVRAHPDDERIHAARGMALAGFGDRAGALSEAEWLRQSAPYRTDRFTGRIVVTNRARILAALGDVDGAAAELESVLSAPSDQTIHTLRLDPSWDPIRTSPRFKALLVKYADIGGFGGVIAP